MSKTQKDDATMRDWLGDEVKGLPPLDLAAAMDRLYAAGPDEDAVAAAKQALDARLAGELPPTINYAGYEDETFGQIYVAAGPQGLVSVDFNVSEDEFLDYIARLGRPRHAPETVGRYMHDIQDYLAGRRNAFDLAVDLSQLTEFQRSVLEEARRVPRGQVATYAEIAERIGKPKAARAVGQALRRNPVPIVVPCHRVINSDGSLGGYGGKLGSQRKINLLKLEGVVFA
jgi:methylated-DNA-[protein]-cysteine S-methyltransferase